MITKFKPSSDKAKFIVQLNRNEKYIDRVSPSKHDYYIYIGSDLKHIVEVDIKAKEVINVNALMGVVIPKSRELLTSKIKNTECTQKALKKFCFEPYIKSTNSRSPNTSYTNKEKRNQEERYDSNIFLYSIYCNNGKINKLIDKTNVSDEDISRAIEVKPKKIKKSGMNTVRNTIDDLYLFLITTHKGVMQKINGVFSLMGSQSSSILQFTDPKYLYKYNSLALSKFNTTSDLKNEEISALETDFNNTFRDKNLFSHAQELIIEYTINSYVDGNQATRYFGFTQNQRDQGMQSLSMNITFIDPKTKEIIGEVEYNAFLKGGLFGGTVGLLNDAVNDITKYAKMNFIKQ